MLARSGTPVLNSMVRECLTEKVTSEHEPEPGREGAWSKLGTGASSTKVLRGD